MVSLHVTLKLGHIVPVVRDMALAHEADNRACWHHDFNWEISGLSDSEKSLISISLSIRLPSILFVNVAKMKVILQIGLPFNVISKKRIFTLKAR